MYKELYLTITNECQLRCPHCYKDDYGLSVFNLNDVKILFLVQNSHIFEETALH